MHVLYGTQRSQIVAVIINIFLQKYREIPIN
jgi:hypothetical protein